jgi:hypothetical protein
MSVAVLDPVAPAVSGDDDLTHLTCCQPEVAICGADLTDGEDVPALADDEPMCRLCIYADENDVPCPTVSCPVGGPR